MPAALTFFYNFLDKNRHPEMIWTLSDKKQQKNSCINPRAGIHEKNQM
jgi:hypothetical protein